MCFFWSALTDLQHGCNFGLQKPLDILRDMIAQFGENIPKTAIQDSLMPRNFMASDKDNELQGASSASDRQTVDTHQITQIEAQKWDPLALWETGARDPELEGDDWHLNDTLYGLVASGPPVY
jgi:hypothetical protein